MRPFRFQRGEGPPTVLCLGAHCDDIEIGCGGTLAGLRRSDPEATIHCVFFSSNEERRSESTKAVRLLLGEGPQTQLTFHGFRDGFLPYHGAEVKDAFEALKQEIDPDLILTHHRHDLHQDHRQVCELTWNTWRNHTILEYEVPKWDGDLGQPNAFVHLDEDIVEKKVNALLSAHVSQSQKAWFDADTFRSLMRLRGLESNAPSRFAEAFFTPKVAVEL